MCLLDLTKAFDLVKLSKLFDKLRGKVPPVHLRVLIYSYIEQQCNVKWGSSSSGSFSISNGVRQGAVSSPVLFSLYIDSLFGILQDSGYGCVIDQLYYGVFAYADDIVLLSPTRAGLQEMLNTCYSFFTDHGIKISTNPDLTKSKSKCMFFNTQQEPIKISLNGLDIPWVPSYKHLGHLLHDSEDWDSDLLQKRGIFIGGFHELQQELGLQDPSVMLKLVNTYISSFYGSPLWDLNSVKSNQLWTAWNKMINVTFKLPFGTHRYILNELSTIPHLKTMLQKRFTKFRSSLEACTKPQVKHLQYIQAEDCRSPYGRNCLNITPEIQAADYFPVPEEEKWRIHIVNDILNCKIIGFTDSELRDLLSFVCVT